MNKFIKFKELNRERERERERERAILRAVFLLRFSKKKKYFDFVIMDHNYQLDKSKRLFHAFERYLCENKSTYLILLYDINFNIMIFFFP